MDVINKRIDDIKPYENNPRKNDAAVQYVANSIREFGFNAEGEILDDNKYTAEINIPQYEVAGESVTLGQLVDTSWADELIEEIEASQVSEAEKIFLIEAAKRHNRFNYRNIAEYYAEASEEMQRLMERSALVIIDFDDAIKNGYVQLSKDMEGFIDDE